MQSVPGTARVETSLISPNIQRLTQSLGRTDHPLSIIFSAPGVAKEAGGNSRSAGPGFREEAVCVVSFPLVAIQGLFSCFFSISVLIRVIANRSMRCLGRVDGNNQSTKCSFFRVLRCTLGMSFLDLVFSGTCMVGVFSQYMLLCMLCKKLEARRISALIILIVVWQGVVPKLVAMINVRTHAKRKHEP